GVRRPTGVTYGPGVTRPTGATPGPGVTRPTGSTPGPGVPRAVGATPGPNVGRPTGGEFGPGVERPTGATFGFTFRPLFQEPFRAGDRFRRREAVFAGDERSELSPEGAVRPDLLVDAAHRLHPCRFDPAVD